MLRRAILRVQGPIRVGEHSEPQPDVALLRPRPDFYTTAHPGSEDVLLQPSSQGYQTVRTFRRGDLPAASRALPEVKLAVEALLP